MSMYNLVHGRNPFAGVLLVALDLMPPVEKIPRFRDCWWDGTYICVHTRTGGGNRQSYEKRLCKQNRDAGPWNDDLRKVAGYSHDKDDPYDSTYATFYYIPSAALRVALAGIQATVATPEQRWKVFIDRIGTHPDDPQVKRVNEAMRPVIDKLAALAKQK